MVWFSEDVLSTEMIFENFMLRLKSIPLEEGEDEGFGKKSTESKEELLSPTLQVQAAQRTFYSFKDLLYFSL